MIHTSAKKSIGIGSVLMLVFLHTSFTQTTNDFGNKEWISNGFAGKVYALPENTEQLPDFDTMKSLGTIYTKEINIPNRDWIEGFPGVTDRFEWFGIEYKGSFRVKKAGHYLFQLYSDDGSKLFIDDKLIIDNDGTHSQRERSGEIDLDKSAHTIKIQYYQGPRTEIALQLFATLDNEKQEVFPGNYFELSTPGSGSTYSGFQGYFIWILLILFLILIFLLIKRYGWKRAYPLRVSHFSQFNSRNK